LNLHLLDSAYLPALGLGAWWTVFVLTLHTVWSVSVSIGLAEALVPKRSTTPWLGTSLLVVVGLVFVLAAAAAGSFSIKQDPSHFVATRAQFFPAGVVLFAVASSAFCLPKRSSPRVPGSVPSPWLIGLAALVAASFFLVIPHKWGWLAVAAYVALDALTIAAVLIWSRRTGWDARHRLGLAGGAALAYAWHAFVASPAVGHAGTRNRIGNAVFATGAVILLAIAARRTSSEVQLVKCNVLA
jgi:hypothetical protein